MKTIDQLILEAENGIVCSESESAEIKGFVKDFSIQLGNADAKRIQKIQLLFPNEYGEAVDESTLIRPSN